MGLTERQTPTAHGRSPPVLPIENSTRRQEQPSSAKCPHCENMAKNFLYLESLMRANIDPKYQCSLCYSALKYLQYVNKGIMEVFGNFDSIVKAAKVFTQHPNHHPKGKKTAPKNSEPKAKTNAPTSSQSPPAESKDKIATRKKSKSRLSGPTKKTGGGSNENSRFSLAGKKHKSSAKNSLKKSKGKVMISNLSMRTAEGVFENGSKVTRGGQKKKNDKKGRSSMHLRGLKVKTAKSKRNKVSLIKVSA